MSTLRDRQSRHDKFYRQAKREQFAARSVYKLEELDRRFHLLKAGQRILDLGCRPGSWLQYAAQKVGPRGFVVGLDRQELDIALPPNAVVLVGDVLTMPPETFTEALPENKRGPFDIVMSDMAPDTSGIPITDQARIVELFRRVMELGAIIGAPGSHLVGKIFMGQDFQEVLQDLRRGYSKTHSVRPDATRKCSTEFYLVALQKK